MQTGDCTFSHPKDYFPYLNTSKKSREGSTASLQHLPGWPQTDKSELPRLLLQRRSVLKYSTALQAVVYLAFVRNVDGNSIQYKFFSLETSEDLCLGEYSPISSRVVLGNFWQGLKVFLTRDPLPILWPRFWSHFQTHDPCSGASRHPVPRCFLADDTTSISKPSAAKDCEPSSHLRWNMPKLQRNHYCHFWDAAVKIPAFPQPRAKSVTC